MTNNIRGLTALLLAAAALLAAGCGTAKKSSSHSREESQLQESLLSRTEQAARRESDTLLRSSQSSLLEMTQWKATFAEAIPMSQTRETIPMQSIIDLPDGGKFTSTEGRVSVEIQRRGGDVILTGRCDSVARQCSVFEKQVYRQQDAIDSLNAVIDNLHSKLAQTAYEGKSKADRTNTETLEVKAPSPAKSYFGWFVAGMAVGIVLCIAIRLLWKRFNVGTILKNLLKFI